jgi:hypothetical protein
MSEDKKGIADNKYLPETPSGDSLINTYIVTKTMIMQASTALTS